MKWAKLNFFNIQNADRKTLKNASNGTSSDWKNFLILRQAKRPSGKRACSSNSSAYKLFEPQFQGLRERGLLKPNCFLRAFNNFFIETRERSSQLEANNALAQLLAQRLKACASLQ